jgi:hypothetical protein
MEKKGGWVGEFLKLANVVEQAFQDGLVEICGQMRLPAPSRSWTWTVIQVVDQVILFPDASVGCSAFAFVGFRIRASRMDIRWSGTSGSGTRPALLKYRLPGPGLPGHPGVIGLPLSTKRPRSRRS